MDLKVFQAINNVAGRFYWLDFLGIFFAKYAPYIVVALLVVYWLFRRGNKKVIFFAFIAAVLSRGVVVELIRHFYHRVRPIPVNAVHQLLTNEKWAFPSGHAAFFFALAAFIYCYDKRLGRDLLFMAALIGIARVFVGVHWLGDILAGALVGLICAFLIKRIFGGYIERP